MYRKDFFPTTHTLKLFFELGKCFSEEKLSKKFHSKFFGKVVTMHKLFWEFQSRAPTTRNSRIPGKSGTKCTALSTPRFLHPGNSGKRFVQSDSRFLHQKICHSIFSTVCSREKMFSPLKKIFRVCVMGKKVFFCTNAKKFGHGLPGHARKILLGPTSPLSNQSCWR